MIQRGRWAYWCSFKIKAQRH